MITQPSARAGLLFIKLKEGFKERAYLDIRGIPTYGYGETLNVKMSMSISMEDASELLNKRYDYFESGILEVLMVPVSNNQLGALTSLAYNIGLNAFVHSTLLKRLNSKDPLAYTEFARWNMADGKVIAGLTARRKEEVVLFRTKDSVKR